MNKIQEHPYQKIKHMQLIKMNKCSTSLVIKKIQIKTMENHVYTHLAKSLSLTVQSVGEDADPQDPFCVAGESTKWGNNFSKHLDIIP